MEYIKVPAVNLLTEWNQQRIVTARLEQNGEQARYKRRFAECLIAHHDDHDDD